MADFNQGSRFKRGSEGTFQGKTVVFPQSIDYSQLTFTKFHTITAGQEFRPDLISQEIYLRNDLGWHIMAANNIDAVESLTAGKTIGIPPVIGIII